MKVRVIRPVSSNTENPVIEETYRVYASPNTYISAVQIENGPPSIESRYDVTKASPGVVKAVQEAAEQEFDGCIVGCFVDPGVRAARELVRIPVMGPGEAGLLMSSALGLSVGIVTVVKELIPLIWENAFALGLANKICSIRAVDIPVTSLSDNSNLVNSLAQQAAKLVKEGAHAILLGCTGMTGTAAAVQKILVGKGLDVPVVDPVGAAIVVIQGMIRLGVTHSVGAFSLPPHKRC